MTIHARPAATYRAARRNVCMRPNPMTTTTWGPAWYFAGSKKAHGHRRLPRYVPYVSTSRTYRGPSQRDQARRTAVMQRFMQGVI